MVIQEIVTAGTSTTFVPSPELMPFNPVTSGYRL